MKHFTKKLSLQRQTMRRLTVELASARGGTMGPAIKDADVISADAPRSTLLNGSNNKPVEEGKGEQGGVMPTM